MIEVTEVMFAEAINSNKYVVVYVSAPWCSPCRQFKPTVLKVDEEFKKDVMFCYVNSDDMSSLCGQLKVSAIPTLIFIRGAQQFGRLQGVSSEKQIKQKIQEMIE